MPRYEPTGYPDRIVLAFAGDPARMQAVTWRTGTRVTTAAAEIELHKTDGALNRLIDLRPTSAERFFERPEIPGYDEDRWWEGTDFVRPGGSGGGR